MPHEPERIPIRVVAISRRTLTIESSDAFELREQVWVELHPKQTEVGRIGVVGTVREIREGEVDVRVWGMLPHHRERLRDLIELLDMRNAHSDVRALGPNPVADSA